MEGTNGKTPRRKARMPFHGDLHVQNLALCLVALSLADLLMTSLLLHSGSHFYESNPVARWFFKRWNILGMTLFKFGVVCVIIVLAEIIERARPGRGRLILILACGAAACVVAHGLRLYLDMAG